jgi:DNA-binding protein H-NS
MRVSLSVVGGPAMDRNQLESMSVDELWDLHQEVASVLATRIKDEIHKLENIFEALESGPSVQPSSVQPSEPPKRRRYPKVLPKFQNPERPDETWAGRGRQPQWVTELLEAGKNIEDFRIARAAEAAPA